MNIVPIDNSLFNNINRDNLLLGVDVVQVEDIYYYKLNYNLMIQFDNKSEMEDLKRIRNGIIITKSDKLKSDVKPSFNIPEENKEISDGIFKETW